MTTIRINGTEYNLSDGDNFAITIDSIIVGTQTISLSSDTTKIVVVDGTIDNINNSGNLECGDIHGDVSNRGNLECGDIHGDVSNMGNITRSG